MKKSIAVIAAHPDDEVLGCGGTISRYAAQGYCVNVLIMAEGATSRLLQRDRAACEAELIALKASIGKAHAVLGSHQVCTLDFPDNRMDSVDRLDITKAVEDFLTTAEPSIILTHHPEDLNVDHRRVSEAVQTACRPLPETNLEKILFFEVASSTEWHLGTSNAFTPNYFVDISQFLPQKMAALAAYNQEMRPWPHVRSLQAVEHLARWRGASVGFEAAEAFVVGRILES